MTENNFLAAALAYAAQGWPVFPCVPGKKTPIHTGGFHNATTDESKIRSWWSETPNANIALDCGSAGIAVVDIDCKGGKDGHGNWLAWCESNGVQPNSTMTQRTPSGGYHLIYHGACKSVSDKIASGVDTKSTGGYIMLAPSVVGGKKYSWDTSCSDILPLHQAVAAAANAVPVRKQRQATPQPAGSTVAASGTLVDMVASSGYPLQRKGGLDEWCGPCPWCGGTDRFIVGWTGEGRDGGMRYFCRKCERKGDSVSWLIDMAGVPVVEAKDRLGVHVDPQYRGGTDLDPATIVWPEDSSRPVQTGTDHPWDRHLVRASEMIESKPPAIVWDVEGLLEAASLVVVYGKPGSLKSFVFADLALAIASSRPWLPPAEGVESAPRSVTGGAVGWIDLDNGKRRTHHRIHALARGADIENPNLTFWSFPPCDLTKPATIKAIEMLIRENNLKVLVIDTLINSMNVKNENDNSELRGPLLALRTLVESTGCTIICIHHPKKGQAIGKMSDDLRGGGAIAGALDLALRVEREEGGHRVKIVSTKARGADVADIHAVFTVVQGFDGEMDTASWHSCEGFAGGDEVEIIVDTEHHAMILTAIGEDEVTGNQIFREVKGGKQKLLDSLKYLERNKTITSRTVGQKKLFKVAK